MTSLSNYLRVWICAVALLLTSDTTVAQSNPFVLDPSSPFSITSERSTAALWGDYDADNDLDLFVGGGLDVEESALYRNEGDGVFTRIEFPLAPFTMTGGAWADFDNDGDLDLVLCAISSGTRILRNNGSGAFTLAQTLTATDVRECAVADYDLDGALDLVLVRRFGLSDRLYRNDGSGSFAFVNSAISSTSGDAVSVSWSDYDTDGDPDLYITNTTDQQNFFFENKEGSFVQVTDGPHVEDVTSTVGGSWGDYDGDLDLDLFVANHDGYPNALYRNDSGSFVEFVEDSTSIIRGNRFYSAGSAWGDVDNDGDLDLLVAHRRVDVSFFAPLILYLNDGMGGFVDYRLENSNHGYGTAAVLSDVDVDGDLDLFVTYGGHDVNQSNLYYTNILDNSNAWLQLELVGSRSISNATNATGIGSRVRIKTTVDGVGVWQVREMTVRSGYFAQSGQRLHFGVGDATSVDSLVVDWPNGTQQVLTNVAVNQLLYVAIDQLLHVDEISPTSAITELPRVVDVVLRAYPNPAGASVTVEVHPPEPGVFSVDIFDLRGRRVALLRGHADSSELITLQWDSTRMRQQVPVGRYFFQLRSGGQAWVESVVILR